MPSVVVLTNFPSPYQVEFFDKISGSGDLQLRTLYRHRARPGRRWEMPKLEHEHLFLDDGSTTTAQRRSEWLFGSDLVVFGWYADVLSDSLIRARARTRRPWCYWGERPGFRGWGVLGRYFRALALSPLSRSSAPIWGIGGWAVEGWQREFGQERRYFNVPYYSDLRRFAPDGRSRRKKGARRVLFSGSLIHRKGVDVLAEVFSNVARDYPEIELIWLGEGDQESHLRARLSAFGNRVRFLGFQSWRELPSYYREAEVLCVPSRYDGWGLVVAEGLAAGLPVISTEHTGAARDLISHGINGWRVAAGDPVALEATLREAMDLSDPEFEKMSAAALASVAAHSLDRGAERFTCAARESLASFQ